MMVTERIFLFEILYALFQYTLASVEGHRTGCFPIALVVRVENQSRLLSILAR